MQKKYHLLGYIIVSIFFGLAITLGLASWTAGGETEFMTQFWTILPAGMFLGFLAAIFIYCCGAKEAGLL